MWMLSGPGMLPLCLSSFLLPSSVVFAFDVAAAGYAILFLSVLVASTLVGTLVLAYAGHCLLVVIEGTAAGVDRVAWPDDPLTDWVLGAARLGALVALWLVPAALLNNALRHAFLPDDPGRRFLLLAVPGLWLIFPVGILSALSSTSGWAPVRLTILGQLLRLFPSTVGFYLLSLVVLAVPAVLWYVTLFTQAFYVLPLAAVAGAAALLIYARLLGRLAWLIAQLKPLPPTRSKQRPAGKASRKSTNRRARRRPSQAEDPWKIPEDEPEPESESESERPSPRPRGVIPRSPDEVESYGLASDKPAEPPTEEKQPPLPSGGPPPRPRGVSPRSPDEVESYGVAAEEPVPASRAASPEDRDAITSAPRPATEKRPRGTDDESGRELTAYEERLLGYGPAEPIPSSPLFSGVYTFPLYESSLKAWVWLSAGGLAFGMCLRGLVAFWPGGQ